MESQIDKQEYTASAQSRGREGTGGINQPTIRCLWGFLLLLFYRSYLFPWRNHQSVSVTERWLRDIWELIRN